jgi:hypothetical protein
MGPAEGRCGRIDGCPLGQHTVYQGPVLSRQVRGLRCERVAGLGMHRVKFAVTRKVRMEGHEPKTAAEALSEEEVSGELGGEIKVFSSHPVLDEVQLAVEIGHEQPPRPTRDLTQEVDPRPTVQSRIVRRWPFRPRYRDKFLEGQRQAGHNRFFGNRIGDRTVGARGSRGSPPSERPAGRCHGDNDRQ